MSSPPQPSAPPIPPTMRAWTFSTRGTPSNILTWTSSLPTPILTPSQILIRISHAALNPGGTTAMALMPTILRVKNSIPEIDFAGTVVARGAFAPSHLTIGTRVFGAIHLKSMNRGMGTLADYIAIGETDGGVAVLPDRVSFEQGAGLAGCGITGLGMWREAGCQEGDRVLVNGASGGAGTMAVQVAKALGTGKVVGICSGRNAEMVRGLGADEVVDYQANHPVEAYLAKRYKDQPFDHILDTIGVQGLYLKSPRYLKKSGTFINIGGYEGGFLRMLWNAFKNWAWPSWLGGTPRKFMMMTTGATNESVEVISKFAAEGKVRTVVEGVFNIENVLEAYKLLASKRTRGKIIIRIQDSEGVRKGV